MLSINTERPYTALTGWQHDEHVVITLVGVGGTGSALAIDLARLCYHAQQAGKRISLQLIDGDRVEKKNVGRQQFSEWEIGKNKAEAMAVRLCEWLAIDVVATPRYLAKSTELWGVPGTYRGARRLLVGAVDNHKARLAIAHHTKDSFGNWWIDCGNDDSSGQVLIGNSFNEYFVDADHHFGTVNGLPAPPLQMPGLLKKPVVQPRPADCAADMATGEQGLYVNRLMATWAASAAEHLVMRGAINYMAVYASLDPPSTECKPAFWSQMQQFDMKFREKSYDEEE